MDSFLDSDTPLYDEDLFARLLARVQGETDPPLTERGAFTDEGAEIQIQLLTILVELTLDDVLADLATNHGLPIEDLTTGDLRLIHQTADGLALTAQEHIVNAFLEAKATGAR